MSLPPLPSPPPNLKNNNLPTWGTALWNYLVALVLAIARWSPPPCRAVITSMGTFDGSGTGTLTGRFAGPFLADDVEVEQNDRVFLPATIALACGGTLADQGPYIVAQVGGPNQRYVLQRPAEWAINMTMTTVTTFRIAEGTIWAGNEWRAFPAKSAAIIGVDDPAFWPRTFAAVLREDVVHVDFWLRDVNRITVQPLATLTPPPSHGYCLSVATPGAGNGRVAVRGIGRGDSYAVMAINF